MIITSDVKSRLKKIRSGVVYGHLHSVIDELIQNCQRANATEVHIRLNGPSLTVKDNGSGCKDPSLVFTLDKSGFGYGFGEGFTSVYMVADYLRVKSYDWSGGLDVEEALNSPEKDIKVNIEKTDDEIDGFEVELVGETIANHQHSLLEHIEKAAAVIPGISFYLNGKNIAKKDLFDVEHNSPYFYRFNNSMYEGLLFLTDTHSPDSKIEVYHEYRYVTNIYVQGLSGVILLKKDAVNLRTPDRKGIVYDEKRKELQNQIHEDFKYLIKLLLKDGDEKYINDFSQIIDEFFDVEEYMRYLFIDPDEISNQYETRKKAATKKTKLFNAEASGEDSEIESKEESEEDLREVDVALDDEEQENDLNCVYNHQSEHHESNWDTERDTKRIEEDQSFTAYIGVDSDRNLQKNRVTINNIKKKANVAWVEKEHVETYRNLITEYEYYGIYTFVSPNILYDKALRYIGIPHISLLEEKGLRKEYKVTKIGARSKKEERALEILGMIEEYYSLGETFKISNIEAKMIIELRGTRIYQEEFQVKGYTKGNEIHLNRKHLKLGKLSSANLGNKKLGVHDVKFVLSNISTIAHELAHLLFGTKDNTVRHYENQITLQDDIARFISTL